uniref:PH domain-containing protein n=1 Tax=Alexandrium monilatum TaxID=311494 RepID=A0A7S4PY15_9DINO
MAQVEPVILGSTASAPQRSPQMAMATESIDNIDLPSSPVAGTPHGTSASSRGKVTGWLLKRKSEGVTSRLFRSANKRYFTLDFEGHLFYYAHTEGNKNASLPVAFRNLLSVEPFEADSLNDGVIDEQDSSDQLGEQRKGSKEAQQHHRTWVPKISFSALKRQGPAKHHGFMLRIVGKEMEWLCSSKAEADSWIAALREAITLGAEARAGEETSKVESSTSAGSSPKAPLSPRSDAEDSVPEVCMPRSSPEAIAEAQEALSGKKVNSPRNTRAFGAEEPMEADAKDAGTAAARPSRRGLGNLLPRRLGGRSRASERSQAEGATVTSLEFEAELLKEAGTQAWTDDEGDRAGVASNPVSEVTRRYEDKGRGLSVKERLAQMDFSDDEDE